MASAHLHAKVIGRSAGSSAVASAAYRSGESLYDERADKRFDYQHRDGVMHTEISTPDGAPAWASDRSRLWNRVEATEKRKDAQLARDLDGALPRELNLDQQKAFVRDFVSANFTSRGMVADWAIHESDAGDGGKNPHVHIMLTMRQLDGDGFGGKAREWNNPNLVTEWRSSWETLQNRHLDFAGADARISMDSYEAQGVNKEATEHLGVDAHQLEMEGIETEIGDRNRAVEHRNGIREAVAERADMDGATGFFDFLDSRAANVPQEATSAASRTPAQEHQSTLADYFRVTAERTAEATAELVNRMSDWAERGRESFERFIRDESSGYDREEERAR